MKNVPRWVPALGLLAAAALIIWSQAHHTAKPAPEGFVAAVHQNAAAVGPYAALPDGTLTVLKDDVCSALDGPRTGLAAVLVVQRAPGHPTGATPAQDGQFVVIASAPAGCDRPDSYVTDLE